jgi:hypothetical protein
MGFSFFFDEQDTREEKSIAHNSLSLLLSLSPSAVSAPLATQTQNHDFTQARAYHRRGR